jgi:hypothetical protein
VKKAARKPKDDFAEKMQQIRDVLPEIMKLMKPEPPPQLPYTPYKPPPDRWVFREAHGCQPDPTVRGRRFGGTL